MLERIDGLLEKAGCSPKSRKQIGMAVEEIFINITSYAYPDGTGDAEILANIDPDTDTAEISISDTGEPYDPLERPDPDLEMDVEERQSGGFGIYMVREAMDDAEYKREDGKNILTVRKRLH